jgi:hypothetical protein
MAQAAMTPVVAYIINSQRRWSGTVVLYLIVISGFSVLSASKGGAILSMLAIASLLDFERARDYVRILRIPIAGTIMLLLATVIYVGKFLTLKPAEIISLMFSRIFLANDGRALAIDWSGYLGYNSTSILRESFRLYAGLIGNSPKNLPLGQLLYALEFGTTGLVGANTSSTALLIAYGGDVGRIFFALLLAGAAVGVGLLADIPGRGNASRLAVGILLLSLLTQDFLAFQVLVNTLILLSVTVLGGTMLMRLVRRASADGAMT